MEVVTLGSCDSSRIARPGRLVAPRFGLILGILGLGLGVAAGCVEQPLIPVSQPDDTGGTAGTGVGARGGGGGGSAVGDGGGGRHGSTTGSGGVAPSGGNSGVGGKPSVCWAQLGERCESPSECCNGYTCRNGVCDTCLTQNLNCSQHSDCCSGYCNSKHRCQDPGGGCFVAGIPCSEHGACCSGQCRPSGSSGVGSTCVAVDGCQPLAESCRNNSDCCSGYCSSQTKRCEKIQTCLDRGELCSVASKDGSDCCNEEPVPTACRTDVGGIATRCASATCKSDNETCYHAAECCQSMAQKPKQCLYVGGDYSKRRCVECGPVMSGCILNSDCCEGLVCDNFSAFTSTFTCIEPGNSNGSGGTTGNGTSSGTGNDACIPLDRECGDASGGGGAAGSDASPCCGSAVCDMTESPPKCVPRN